MLYHLSGNAMQFFRILIWPQATLLWVAALAPWLDGAHAAQPNLLFILTEDQGAQVSHPAFVQQHSAGVETPAIDAILRSGVAFTQAFVATPVCSASKAAIYTGLYCHANGVRQNTINYFKPVDQITPKEKSFWLYQQAAVAPGTPTLVTLLKEAGYYSGVTGKLHIGPNELFPYDQWLKPATAPSVQTVIQAARKANKPWFVLLNPADPHRRFGAADRVNPAEVSLPGQFPDTPTARVEWASYLSDVERADDKVGGVLQLLDQLGERENTIIVYMGDHGPGLHRGKMSPYDFGMRTVMAIAGPGVQKGGVCDQPVCSIDLLPTLLEMMGVSAPDGLHGKSLSPILKRAHSTEADPPGLHDYVVGEVSSSKIDSNGIQERTIFDGRWRLIYREKINEPCQVNVDLWWTDHGGPGNAPTYSEIIARRDEFADEFRMLAKLNNGQFHTHSPQFELYDQGAGDIDNLNNLADKPETQATQNRLFAALRLWAIETDDQDTALQTLGGYGEKVSDGFESFEVRHNGRPKEPVVYVTNEGSLGDAPDWTVRRGEGFEFDHGELVAKTSREPTIATHDTLEATAGQAFQASLRLRVDGRDSAAGLVFGWQDDANYYLLEAETATKPGSLKVGLRRVQDGASKRIAGLEGRQVQTSDWLRIGVRYDPAARRLELKADQGGAPFANALQLKEPLVPGGRFGVAACGGPWARLDDFVAQVEANRVTLGDSNDDGELTAVDLALLKATYGPSAGLASRYNFALPDDVIDDADARAWQAKIKPAVEAAKRSRNTTGVTKTSAIKGNP